MDYYAILEVPKNATPDDIKKSYKRLAMKYHPDRNNGDDTHFKKIQEAYETLSNQDKRNQYDNPNPFANFSAHNQDINDIFAQVFGFRRQQAQVVRTQITISLVDAYTGSHHFVQLNTQTGTKLVKLDIPAGVQSGSSLKYDNVIEGAVMVVNIHVLTDTRFERKDQDLYSTHNISVFDLILGTKFKFTTISGKTLEVTAKPRTQPNTQLRIPNMGMPRGNGSFGDQIILLNSYIPDNIDSEIIQTIGKFVK